jgi:hypothetical protein
MPEVEPSVEVKTMLAVILCKEHEALHEVEKSVFKLLLELQKALSVRSGDDAAS